MSAAVVYAQLKAFDSTLQRAILIYPTRVYSIDVTINATIQEFHKICTTFRHDALNKRHCWLAPLAGNKSTTYEIFERIKFSFSSVLHS